MNTRAASTLMIIFEVIVVIAVVSLTVNIASSYASGQAIVASTTTEDLALMVETLIASPGDALVEYPFDVTIPYTIILSNEKVILFSKTTAETRVEKNVYLPTGYSAQGSVEEKVRVCLEKKQKSITLRECP